jgi:hypothetical protein
LEKTWVPRVTEALVEADDDGWAAAEPAADGNTLEASAEADAIKVDVAVAAPGVVVPLAAPVVAVAAPVV